MLFRCKGMNKAFGATKALTDVTVELRAGEVHGLVGENGSGKSTLASIIAGIRPADSGEMLLCDRPHQPRSIAEAEKGGVAMVVQEQGTVNDISVAANLFLGAEERFSKCGFTDLTAMKNAAQAALNDIGASGIRADMPINGLSFEDRKLVEIARAMSVQPELLIIDETTTALATGGRAIIKSILNRMRDAGKSVLFISHDLDELMEACDTITVLRDGNVIGTYDVSELTIPRLQELMVGRDVSDGYYREDYGAAVEGEVAMRVEHLSSGALLEDVSFDLHYGEILGICGLSDCGIHDLGKAMFGLDKLITGTVTLTRKGLRIADSKTALQNHIAYISKNRDTESLVLQAPILENIAMANMDNLERGLFLSKRRQRAYADDVIQRMRIKCREPEQYVCELSGGNKQKVVFGKWVGNDSEVFLLDCPTRGVDIGVKASMYELMDNLRREGKAILLISEELPELIGMSDRLLVFKQGRLQKEFLRDRGLAENDVIKYMI